jgi:cold shock CspA family protein
MSSNDSAASNLRMRGTVTAFNPLRGFGFINCPGHADFFLHISQCEGQRTPRIGEQVTFIPAPPTRGQKWEATQIEFLNGTNGTNNDHSH